MDFKNISGIPNIPSFKGVEPKFNVMDGKLEALKELNDQQVSAVNEVLSFLTDQSNIAERQFKTSRNLILATILIMIFQIGYAVWTNSESNSIQSSLTKIVDTQSKQSESVSRMSLNLLDLQNQVQILEQENARLNQQNGK
ncbi:hypothetical protein [Maribacter sp. MAR_2009_72]|uniref:hypothetical protein n=1 Tax=Maribacter sp. MAR_2009_72 TaxID=1250050 RepID=UPI00119A99D2|nr:hypothetical protein [Maribacter sp. MAR_2009_72]TVZ15607.1 hypothetical protein JM81_1855 [Maribacter sp. MAR_2009_72]